MGGTIGNAQCLKTLRVFALWVAEVARIPEAGHLKSSMSLNQNTGRPFARWRYALLAAVGVGIATPGAVAQAQTPFKPTVRFTPSLGLYLPFSGYLIDEPQRGTVPALSKRQIQTGIAFGRMALWFRRRVAVEGSCGYGRGMVAIHDSTQARVVSDIGATLWLANVTGLYRVVPDTKRQLSLFTGAGVGVVGRSGQAWLDTPARTVASAVVLVGVSAALGRRDDGHAIRLQVEDNLTSAHFNVGLPSETRVRLHHDLIWSLGISVNLWRAR